MDALVWMHLSSEAYLYILEYTLASGEEKRLAVLSYFKKCVLVTN